MSITDKQIINLLDNDSWEISRYSQSIGGPAEFIFQTEIALNGIKAMLAHAYREGLLAGEGTKRLNPYE